MPRIPDPSKQWYVVHVLSGQESRVKERILRQIEVEEMGESVFQVLVPVETITEVKKGKKSEVKKKFFPGYVLINMRLLQEDGSMDNRAWYFILGIDGVIGFAGGKERPVPMRGKEVEAMLAQIQERGESSRPRITFEVGDRVKVNDGPFESQEGTVDEIDQERGTLRVSVEIFGRATPVDLEYWQVEPCQ